MSEEESIRLFYSDVGIQSYRIVSYNFDEVRFHLYYDEGHSEWNINEVSNCNVEEAQIIVKPGSFFSSEFRKEEDDECNVIKIDFNIDACNAIKCHIKEPYVQEEKIKLRRAVLLLVDSGVISFVQEFEFENYRMAFDQLRWKKFENAIYAANTRLIQLFIKIIKTLEKSKITEYFKTIPMRFFIPGGVISEGHRYDSYFFAETLNEQVFNSLSTLFSTSKKAIPIGDSEVYVGWSCHIIKSYKAISELDCLSLIKVSTIALGAFVGASSIAGAIRNITIQILSGKIDIPEIKIINLILFGNQLLLRCNEMKGLLTDQEAALLEATNDACKLSREIQQFHESSENIVQGITGLEQERTNQANKAIQIILLFLSSITIVSVIKDALDYWSLKIPPTNWYSLSSVILIATLIVVIGISYIFGKKIMSK